jgi:hypothetical protein
MGRGERIVGVSSSLREERAKGSGAEGRYRSAWYGAVKEKEWISGEAGQWMVCIGGGGSRSVTKTSSDCFVVSFLFCICVFFSPFCANPGSEIRALGHSRTPSRIVPPIRKKRRTRKQNYPKRRC